MSVVERYLELGLRLRRHADDLVDSYFGPPEIEKRVAAEAMAEPAALVRDASALLEETDDRWLSAQVGALLATARRLDGEQLSYNDEVEQTYGITPEWTDESAFESGRAELEAALPGSGSVRERYARWLEQSAIPPAALEDAMRETVAYLRERVRATIGLPEGEDIELHIVTGKPWLGYARYLSGLRSEVSVNTDVPFRADDLAHFAAHEVYSGHHTHRIWQEVELVRGRGELERSLDLLWSPEALISEGVAELAADLFAGADAHAVVAEILARHRFTYDAEAGWAMARAREKLGDVGANVSILLHDRGASEAEALDYARTWSLLPEERLRRIIGFVQPQDANDSRGYVHTYTQGLKLVRAHTQGDPQRLRALLTDRLLPADLAA
jgi:hypothetical protein